MTSGAIRRLLLCLALGVGFMIGAGTAVVRDWGKPTVTVDVINKTGKPIRAATFKYETCSRQFSLVETEPRSDATTTYKLALCGEGSYVLHVEFLDGSKLASRGAYVEGGYKMTEVILPSTIESSFSLYSQ